jgi:ParB/RepB/Spo0J family partition protein
MAKSKLDSVKTKSFDAFTAKKNTPSKETLKQFEETYITIPIDLIKTDTNIRTEYDEEEIQNLAHSMKDYGQLEPVRVYEEKNDYIIIFGHRRLRAAKIAGLLELKAIISEKPDNLNKIYIQAIENEQSVNISSSDREKYIKMLTEKPYLQTPKEIAEKMGKSIKWIYSCLNAPEIRAKYEKKFKQAGISLSTYDTTILNNADEQEIEKALAMALAKPTKKTTLLKEIEQTKPKKQPTAKTKPSAPYNLPETPVKQTDNIEPDNSEFTSEIEIADPATKSEQLVSNFKKMEIKITLLRNDDTMQVKYSLNSLGDMYESNIINLLTEKITTYYEDENYVIIK